MTWKWTHSLTLELPNGYRNTITMTDDHGDSPLVILQTDWAKHIQDMIDRGELPPEATIDNGSS